MLDLAYLARLEWLARFARQIKETKAAAIAEAKQRTREAVSGYILSLVIPGFASGLDILFEKFRGVFRT